MQMLLINVSWSKTILKVYQIVTLTWKASNTTTNLLNGWPTDRPTDRPTFKRKIEQSNLRARLLTLHWKVALHLTLIMTSAEVVETIVAVSNNSPFQDSSNQENQTNPNPNHLLSYHLLSREFLVTFSFFHFFFERRKEVLSDLKYVKHSMALLP